MPRTNPLLLTAALGLAGLAGLPSLAAAQTRNVDVVFVVDNSGSMAEEQQALVANFPSFINALSSLPGGLPNLHLGVVSSNLGAGPDVINGCQGQGDGGQLQTGPYFDPDLPTCNDRPNGAFISDIELPDGTRERNYDGEMADNFTCIARLGTKGCGFEQHLASLKQALSGAVDGNAGFLRDDAILAVVVVADEDDCSASDTSIYGTSPNGPFGPLASFRCTRFGITCNPPIDGNSSGPQTDCGPAFDSDYITNPHEFVDFLGALKGNPQRVVFGLIAGNPEPVNIGFDFPQNPENQELSPSCTSSGGDAVPAIRLNWVAQQFPHNIYSSICNSDQSDVLEVVALQIGDAMGAFGTEPDAGPSGPPDAGPGEPDAGEPDAGAPDAGAPDNLADAGVDAATPAGSDAGITPDPKDDGCGCATTSGSGAATTGFFFLLGLVALRRRRR